MKATSSITKISLRAEAAERKLLRQLNRREISQAEYDRAIVLVEAKRKAAITKLINA